MRLELHEALDLERRGLMIRHGLSLRSHPSSPPPPTAFPDTWPVGPPSVCRRTPTAALFRRGLSCRTSPLRSPLAGRVSEVHRPRQSGKAERPRGGRAKI